MTIKIFYIAKKIYLAKKPDILAFKEKRTKWNFIENLRKFRNNKTTSIPENEFIDEQKEYQKKFNKIKNHEKFKKIVLENNIEIANNNQEEDLFITSDGFIISQI